MRRRPALAALSIAALHVLATLATPSAAEVAGDDLLEPPPALRVASTMGAPRPAVQAELARSPAWQAFRSRHGRWSAWWNENTRTPHRALGPPIPLAGFADDRDGVDRAVRAFVADHAEIFLDPELENVAIRRVGGTWYARYRQIVEGEPVLLSDWEFRVSARGRLCLFGADAYPRATPSVRARLTREATRSLALDAAMLPGRIVEAAGSSRASWLPVRRGEAIVLRPVYEFRARTTNPTDEWAILVDAASGATLERRSLVCHAITGRVQGRVHPGSFYDAEATRDFPWLRVVSGADTTVTDSAGAFALSSPGATIDLALRGRYAAVHRVDGPSASASVPVGTDPHDVLWDDGNSQAAERDVYLHTNAAHDLIQRIDPGFTQLDYPVPVDVNVPQSACNAYWDGDGMGFGAADATCQSTASTVSIVYHEYGHGISIEIYRDGLGDSLQYISNGVVSEGTAELNSMLSLDDPRDGLGLYGPDWMARRDDIEARWPEDHSSNPYNTMFILTGSFWDLRNEAGLEVASRLAHFARYGLPDDPDDGVAMTEYFLEAVAADDDDADLSNGTPHLAALLRAFNARGLGTRYFFAFDHVPLADAPAGGALNVTATIRDSGPLGALDPGSPTLFYSIDGAPFVSAPMTPTGNADEFGATIPAPEASLIRYYLRATDTHGGEATLPVGAPARRPFVLLCGAPATLFADDFESDRGWIVGAPGDSATGGVWVRVAPHGTGFILDPVQTDADHTPTPGTRCWVTGDGTNTAVNRDDVDGGRTTLTSPRLDASATTNPVIEYYRWYMNRLVREPDMDYWRAFLSNDDGASWTAVENTTHSENRWERMLVRIADYLPPTGQMRVRFVARDSMGNSTVEGAIDDFRLLGFVPTPATLARFEARALPGAVEITWELADPTAEARLERAGAAQGPWSPITITPRREGARRIVVDPGLEPGRAWFYRLVAIEPDGTSRVLDTRVATPGAERFELALDEAVPNPSSGDRAVRFTLPSAGEAMLRVFDSAGREVERLVQGRLAAGPHEARWSTRRVRVPPGLYFLRLDAGRASLVRKLVVLK